MAHGPNQTRLELHLLEYCPKKDFSLSVYPSLQYGCVRWNNSLGSDDDDDDDNYKMLVDQMVYLHATSVIVLGILHC